MFKRKCYCMNNSYIDSEDLKNDLLENQCRNIVSYEEPNDSCECGFEDEMNIFPDDPMLAQSYVPIQIMDNTFKPQVGLKMGTIFPELVSPYVPCQDMQEIEFIRRTNEIGKGCNQCY